MANCSTIILVGQAAGKQGGRRMPDAGCWMPDDNDGASSI
jgi:hypothetical protein